MKRNWVLRLGVAVLVMSIVTLSLVSGTFAKYTKAYTGASETVTAADFKVAVEDEAGAEYAAAASFNVFDYTNDAIWLDGGPADLVAPGSTGSLELNVENQSQVDVALAVTLNQDNVGLIPIYYTLTTDTVPGTARYSDALAGIEYDTDTHDAYLPLTALATALGNGTTLAATDGSAPVTHEYIINWTWAYELADDTIYDKNAVPVSNDEYDTAIGAVGTAVVTLQINVNATQVEGQPI